LSPELLDAYAYQQYDFYSPINQIGRSREHITMTVMAVLPLSSAVEPTQDEFAVQVRRETKCTLSEAYGLDRLFAAVARSGLATHVVSGDAFSRHVKILDAISGSSLQIASRRHLSSGHFFSLANRAKADTTLIILVTEG
jgi:hypothetical protein